jgi:hypothetical protein
MNGFRWKWNADGSVTQTEWSRDEPLHKVVKTLLVVGADAEGLASLSNVTKSIVNKAQAELLVTSPTPHRDCLGGDFF